jgi:hypothetical protein
LGHCAAVQGSNRPVSKTTCNSTANARLETKEH